MIVKPGDLASGARRTENWYKETHVTTIKRGGGARKNTRVRESEEHTRARRVGFFFNFTVMSTLALTASLNGRYDVC